MKRLKPHEEKNGLMKIPIVKTFVIGLYKQNGGQLVLNLETVEGKRGYAFPMNVAPEMVKAIQEIIELNEKD